MVPIAVISVTNGADFNDILQQFSNEVILDSLRCRVIAIHGDMSQHSRTQALKDFSAGRQHVLVATDVAARGLDIK